MTIGIPQDNIVVWPKNGIEFYYPPTLIDKIFGAGADITIAGDFVSRNGISHNKAELIGKVSSMLEANTEMHQEFEARFLKRLAQRLG